MRYEFSSLMNDLWYAKSRKFNENDRYHFSAGVRCNKTVKQSIQTLYVYDYNLFERSSTHSILCIFSWSKRMKNKLRQLHMCCACVCLTEVEYLHILLHFAIRTFTKNSKIGNKIQN